MNKFHFKIRNTGMSIDSMRVFVEILSLYKQATVLVADFFNFRTQTAVGLLIFPRHFHTAGFSLTYCCVLFTIKFKVLLH